jgi:hypothetical protein
MENDERSIWVAAGVRTPFVGVDGPFAHRDCTAAEILGFRGRDASYLAPPPSGRVEAQASGLASPF